jgi:hypothetical protein
LKVTARSRFRNISVIYRSLVPTRSPRGKTLEGVPPIGARVEPFLSKIHVITLTSPRTINYEAPLSWHHARARHPYTRQGLLLHPRPTPLWANSQLALVGGAVGGVSIVLVSSPSRCRAERFQKQDVAFDYDCCSGVRVSLYWRGRGALQKFIRLVCPGGVAERRR